MRKVIIAIGILLTIVIAVSAVSVIRAVNANARRGMVGTNLDLLAAAAEAYRLDHNVYPDSLEALLAGTTPEMKSIMERRCVLHDEFDDTYGYSLSTNGFRFVVTARGSVFLPFEAIEKSYTFGEVLR